MARQRLDHYLIDLGYDPREAQGLILSGRVLVNDQLESRCGALLRSGQSVRISLREGEREGYPSRAAFKLQTALSQIEPPIDLLGRIAVDIGASHGGFSQVLLEAGVSRLYAIDVAYGIFDYQLRHRPEVVLLERHNIRHLSSSWFTAGDLVSSDLRGFFYSCDVSFISVLRVFEAIARMYDQEGLHFAVAQMEGLFLLKPQFEDSAATDDGVLRDEGRRDEIVASIVDRAESLGFRQLSPLFPAAVTGRRGNQEYLLHLIFQL